MAVHALQQGGALNEQMNIHLVVATLVATVTFAAGFAIPGGYVDTSGADPGRATLLYSSMFHAFVICNTVATYSAISTVLIWLWTQLDDSYIALSAHVAASVAMLVSLGTMSTAFMAGSYVLVSKFTWLASFVLVTGASALFFFCLHYVGMYAPLGMYQRSLRSISFYGICLAIALSRSLLRFPDVMEEG